MGPQYEIGFKEKKFAKIFFIFCSNGKKSYFLYKFYPWTKYNKANRE